MHTRHNKEKKHIENHTDDFTEMKSKLFRCDSTNPVQNSSFMGDKFGKAFQNAKPRSGAWGTFGFIAGGIGLVGVTDHRVREL